MQTERLLIVADINVHALDSMVTSYILVLSPIAGLTVSVKQISKASGCQQPKEKDVCRTLPLSMEGKSSFNQKNLKSTEYS